MIVGNWLPNCNHMNTQNPAYTRGLKRIAKLAFTQNYIHNFELIFQLSFGATVVTIKCNFKVMVQAVKTATNVIIKLGCVHYTIWCGPSVDPECMYTKLFFFPPFFYHEYTL
ncbi:hypothetical protein AHAS_Ahas08G0162500 [Arachis hypogaea]